MPTPACAVPLNWGAAEKWGAKKFFRPVPPPTLNLLPMTLKDKDKEPGKESKDVWICEACGMSIKMITVDYWNLRDAKGTSVQNA